MTEHDAGAPAARHGVLFTVAYDGRPFSGFARQPRARTVAGELDGAIRAIDARASLVRGTSRTDAGVHARAQKVAFDTTLDIPARGWLLAVSPHLPAEIAITHAARVPFAFDPRRHVVSKTYRYVVFESDVRDPFLEGRAWRVADRLNHELLRDELASLIGQHDFAAFRGASDTRDDTVRKIVRAEVRNARSDPRCLLIDVEGDRFMYRMVRIIVGTLIDVGRGRLKSGAISRAIASRARTDLGITAPPEGLYLERTTLVDSGQDGWPIVGPFIDDLPIVA